MLPVVRHGKAPVSAMAPFAPVNRIATLFDRLLAETPFEPMAAWNTPAAVWEDEGSVHVEADMPGLTDKDVELSVHEGHLILRGERKGERREGGFDSRWFGRFEERIALPTAVDADSADAKLVNGVLTVTLPKKEEARARRIALKVG